MSAAYLSLTEHDLLERAQEARRLSSPCSLCPRRCGADRVADVAGTCGLGAQARVSSANLHHGEEPPISGERGSGTIFFTGCNLACKFCQNYPISQLRHGKLHSSRELAEAMLRLQERGAHNINLVTPSHATWPFLEALALAVPRGLSVPIVYNSSGYESPESLRLLDGVIDIYLPDLKYADDRNARRYSKAENYWDTATRALKEMHRQVGDLECDAQGIAVRGLIVRHLVLPGGLSGTGRVLGFLAESLGRGVFVSLMRQYFPANQARDNAPLDRVVTDAEFELARTELVKLGLDNGWTQE